MSWNKHHSRARALAARFGGGSPIAQVEEPRRPATPGLQGEASKGRQGDLLTEGSTPAGILEQGGREIAGHHTATAPPATGGGRTAPSPPAATDPRRHTPLSDTGGQSIGHSTPNPQQKTHAGPKQHTLHTHTIHIVQQKILV